MRIRTLSVLFFIRKTRTLTNNEAPIYLRITVDGDRIETSIRRSINPANWSDKGGFVKHNAPNAGELNTTLNQIRMQIYQIEKDLNDRGKTVTALAIKNALYKTEDDDKRMILQVYQEHNADLKLRIDKGVSRGTYIRHETSRRNVERFILDTYKQPDFYLKDIDQAFIVKYETYLRTVRNCNNNSAVKYIKNMRKIIKLAIDNDWIRADPMRKLKYKIEEVDKPFLSESELKAILNKAFEIPRVAQVRDVFIFCCFTGLAFADVKSLTTHDILAGNDGSLWIKKQRQKSKQWSHIPLLPAARELLDKYKSHPECIRKGVLLPVLSNQKMNAYLKEVADLCGIDKNLTTHCARHTFATTVTLANNISMESVSKMLGHSSLAMTKRYARILDTTIAREMNSLADKMDFSVN